MPIPIGNFISKYVYDSQLKSEHPVSGTNSCYFIDVKDGVEKFSGRSWQVRFGHDYCWTTAHFVILRIFRK